MKSLVVFICLVLVRYATAVSMLRQYVYVPTMMNWFKAQNYCRQNYWDLATITTEEENLRMLKVSVATPFPWIGLNRTKPNAETWQWSDGEELNYTNWHRGEPNNALGMESCTVIYGGQWGDFGCTASLPFICYRRFMLVKETKTWDEAFQYCRTRDSYLAVVDSQTLLDLLKTKDLHAQTVSVWTGLRFLNGKWLWVNGVLLGSLVSLPQCPNPGYRCGAYNFNTSVWENRDCNEKMNFICSK